MTSRGNLQGALLTDPKHTSPFATKKLFLKALPVSPSLLMCQKKEKNKPKRSKRSSLIVLLVGDETDGAGLQSEGVKMGVGGGLGGLLDVLFIFFSFVESPNSLQGKKKCKKGGHVRGKTWGGFSFLYTSSASFCVCTTYV